MTGDSLYNLLPLGEVETDKNDRPLDPPPKIISVEVGLLLFLQSFTFSLLLEFLKIMHSRFTVNTSTL